MSPDLTEQPIVHNQQELTTLLEVSRSLVETLDIEHILQVAADGVTKIVGLDTSAVYLLKDDLLFLWATAPPLPPLFPDELRIAKLKDHPHIQKAITEKKPIFIPDYTRVKLSPEEHSVAIRRNLRTLLFVPLVTDEKVLGAFIVGSIGVPVELTSTTLDMSYTLANLAALAIRNAQLYIDGQNYAIQLEKTLEERIQAEEEAKRLQAQLYQAQKMESIGTLAGGVAHDFNNLLTVIHGYAEMSLHSLDKSDQLHGKISEILKASTRAEKLIRQLLAFSRKQIFKSEVLEINSVIDSMDRMLRRLIGEDIKIETILGKKLPKIKADSTQLEQIFINLIVNARDAVYEQTKPGHQKKITIETGKEFLDENFVEKHGGSKPGPHIFFSVSDNGIGMDTETKERIFEPFYTTKGKLHGTGLGLSTVYGIVKQNHGSVYVYSEFGIGTTFKIYWPITTEDADQNAQKQVSSNKLNGNESILLVEDDHAVRQFTIDALHLLGYDIQSAENGRMALELIESKEKQIDLIITDLIMPELNGKEFIRQLKENDPQLKVIYVSGYADSHIVHDGLLEDNINFLQKPYNVKTLAETVRQVLDEND